jgi:MFS transporter, ACS family, tartrate transporter
MEDLEKHTIEKIFLRLIPFLMICYFVAFLDRVNLGFAALEMNKQLKFSASVFGFGAGIFFLGYLLLEVPSSLVQSHMGARKWIARIMFTWAIVSGATAFVGSLNWVGTDIQFYVVRFILGAAEAGFFPGIVFYLTLWFPQGYRGRIHGLFLCVIPFSAAVGAPLSSLIFYMDGLEGLQGWQWIFILEAAPAVILSIVTWFYLTDDPSAAGWLHD